MNAIKLAIDIIGTQADLARAVGITPQAVNQWVTGRRKVPWCQCQKIEGATNGAVTRHDLRPDIFGPHPSHKTATEVSARQAPEITGRKIKNNIMSK